MKKSAFTMLELVMVIVVLGILAAVALPRYDRDLRQGAESNIVAAIRYTQHMALIDDKTDPRDTNWQQELWTIRFSSYTDSGNTRFFYTISSNINHGGNVDRNETIVDPVTGKYMYNAAGDSTVDADESSNIFIGKKYGVNSVDFAEGCGPAKHVAFDHLGRPFKSGIFGAVALYDGYMVEDCSISIGFEDSNIEDLVITIEKETGHVSTS